MLSSYQTDNIAILEVTKDKYGKTISEVSRNIPCRTEFGTKSVANEAGEIIGATGSFLVDVRYAVPKVGQIATIEGKRYMIVGIKELKHFMLEGWEVFFGAISVR
jgi:hypothetical protein